MKQLCFIALYLCSQLTIAQFDERFYFPKKDWLDIADSIQYEELNIKLESGKISGLYLPPQIEKKGNILFFHGAGGNVTTYLPMTVPLAERGFGVIMIDVRGYGKSEGKPTHIGIAEDAPEILSEIKKMKAFKNENFILYGASMGTQIATHLCSQHPEAFKLLVLDGAMLSFTDIALHSAPEEQKGVIQQYVTSPYSAKEDIEKVSIPVLVIHSQADSAVPFQHGKILYELANEPKWIWEYEGEHLEAAQKHADELIQYLLKGLN